MLTSDHPLALRAEVRDKRVEVPAAEGLVPTAHDLGVAAAHLELSRSA
jgi:hypothetical protein